MQKQKPCNKPVDAFAKQTRANAFDPNQLDPIRAKRIISNRQSAHKSRQKKLGQVQTLEAEIQAARAQTEVIIAPLVCSMLLPLHANLFGLCNTSLSCVLCLNSHALVLICP